MTQYMTVKKKYTQGPCPKCASSDAYTVYEDGAFCFSCGFGVKKGKRMGDVTKQYLEWRGITRETMEKFDVLSAVDVNGKPLYLSYKWPNGKILDRSLEEKKFWWTGERINGGELFGMDRFPSGSAKAITITEGAADALAAFQMMDSKYPVVSVSSASAAKNECAKEYDYINGFDKIYICMDSDDPGREAAQSIARLFDFNKVYIIKLRYKDPLEYIEHDDVPQFTKDWWAAKKFMPEGILSSYVEFDDIIDAESEKPSVPYPFERLQQMTYGIRNGEFVLLTAMEGIGKTEIIRAFEYNLLKTTDSNIGIIHLEESKARSIKGLVGQELQAPIHLPDNAIPKQQIKETFRKVTGRDERVHLYSHFGSDDPDVILSTIRFMAASCECKYIFLDHLTMVVSGSQGDDERRQLDYISTRLAMMVEELDFTLFCISHVNDDGKTRGSRNISKVADLRIDLNRNITAPTEQERNTTYLTISKNRYAGKTGPAGALVFNPETWVLSEDFNPEMV